MEKGFWKRQFHGDPVGYQTLFDIWLGIVVPLVCVFMDPMVFRNDHSSDFGGWGRYQPFAYVFIGLEAVIMLIWLAFQHRLSMSSALFSGVLFAGAAFAFALGVTILPFSILGLRVVIGMLGFTPFFTAVSYMRNGVRAIRRGRLAVGNVACAGLFILGVGLPVLPAVYIQQVVKTAFSDVIKDPESKGSIRRAKRIRFFYKCGANDLAHAHKYERDADRRKQLAHAFFEITGEDVREYYVD